jgi:hypothetical protein
VLYRIGRVPDPLAPPPLERSGNNRFDDPAGRFRVLYAAEQRLTCFVETLAPFRLSFEWLAAVGRVRAGDHGHDEPTGGVVPASWLMRRRIGTFALGPNQRWLDLRSMETRIALRRDLAALLAAHDLTDFDLSDALCRNRPVTQSIAQWAFDAGYNGIAYKSRFDCAFDCWAIYDRADLDKIAVETMWSDDGDLTEVARLFDLRVT